MRVDTEDFSTIDLFNFDDPSFRSDLPDETAIAASYGSARFARDLQDGKIGESLTRSAQRATRWAQGFSATNIGVPSDLISSFAGALGPLNASRWREFAAGLSAIPAIDLALDAMGSVPVIGWAADLAVALVDILISASATQKPKPLAVQYSKRRDEDKATEALQLLQAGDLASIFCPINDVIDGWSVIASDPGFRVRHIRGEGSFSGLGVVPGACVISDDLQSLTHWPAGWYASQENPRHAMFKGQISKQARKDIRRFWCEDFSGSITTDGATLPSLARVGGAIWSALSSTRSANAFALDTRGIPEAWSAWADSARLAADQALSGGVKPYMDRIVGFYALDKSTDLSFFGLDDQPCSFGSSGRTIDEEASRRIGEIRRLQSQLLDSLAVAYALPSQAAFNDPAMLEKLNARRAQLLTHPARWRVNPADVVDEEWLVEFTAATPSDQRPQLGFSSPVTGDEFSGTPQRITPLGGNMSEVTRRPRTVPAWALFGLAAAGVYLISRR